MDTPHYKIYIQMIINIYGSSGSGKNTFVKSLFENNTILKSNASSLLETITKIDHTFRDNSSVSLLPINDFHGSISEYFSLFGISIQNIDLKVFQILFPKFTFPDFFKINFNFISMGERRRIDLLRCLLQNKKINFIDEPFSNSDDHFIESIISILTKFKFLVTLSHMPLDTKYFNNIKIETLI